MKVRHFIFKQFPFVKLVYEIKSRAIRRKYPTEGGVSYDCLSLFCCNDICMSGGLCDRLNGIVSLYKVSKEKEIPFKIWYDSPFDLSDFLLPNSVNWQIGKEEINMRLSEIKIVSMPMMYEKLGMTYREECECHMRYLSYLFKHNRPKKQLHIYTNAHLATGDCFSRLFNELFVPSPFLRDALNKNFQRIGSEYISVTFRFQNLLGDFKEGSSCELSKREQEEYIEMCLMQIQKLHSKHPDMKILVTADSVRFCRIANEKYQYVYIIPGNVVHMSYTRDASIDVYLKSFVDLFMLANASKLFLLVTGRMYHSGFAQTASFIYNKPYEVIKF